MRRHVTPLAQKTDGRTKNQTHTNRNMAWPERFQLVPRLQKLLSPKATTQRNQNRWLASPNTCILLIVPPSVRRRWVSEAGREASSRSHSVSLGGGSLFNIHTAPARLPTFTGNSKHTLTHRVRGHGSFFGLFDLDFISTLDSLRPPCHVTRLWTLKTRRQTALF